MGCPIFAAILAIKQSVVTQPDLPLAVADNAIARAVAFVFGFIAYRADRFTHEPNIGRLGKPLKRHFRCCALGETPPYAALLGKAARA